MRRALPAVESSSPENLTSGEAPIPPFGSHTDVKVRILPQGGR